MSRLFRIRGGFVAPRTSITVPKIHHNKNGKFVLGGQTPDVQLTPKAIQAEAKKRLIEHINSKTQPGVGEISVHIGEKLYNHVKTGAAAKAKGAPLFGGEIKGSATGAITESKFISRASRRPSKAFLQVLKSAQRAREVFTAGYKLASTVGTQGIGDMTNITTSSSTFTAGIVPMISPWSGDYSWTNSVAGQFTYNGALHFMANAASTAAGGLTNTSKFYLDSCRIQTTIANACATSVIMDIYEVVAKHDLAASQGNTFANFSVSLPGSGSAAPTNYQNVYSPAYYWKQGLALSTNSNPGAGGSALTYSAPDASPTSSMLFNEYWKVCSKLRVLLPSGASHIHESSYQLKKVMNLMRMTNVQLLSGITRGIMIVIQGPPGYDTNVGMVAVPPVEVLVNTEQTYTSAMFYNSVYQTGYYNLEKDDQAAYVKVETTDNITNVNATSNLL